MRGSTSTLSEELRTIMRNSKILIELRNSSLDKDELADRCSVSTKTIYRRIRQLRDEGYVKKDARQYKLTKLGRLYAEYLHRHIDAFEVLENNREVFSRVDGDFLPPHLLYRAEITSTDSSFSVGLSECIIDYVNNTAIVEAIFGRFDVRHLSAIKEISPVKDLNIVIDARDYTKLEEDHPDILDSLCDFGVDTQHAQIEFPHSVVLVDGSIVVVEINNRHGQGMALLQIPDDDAQHWAKAKLENHR